MRTITHAIDTRPFFRPSVQLEKKTVWNEASDNQTQTLTAMWFLEQQIFTLLLTLYLPLNLAKVSTSICYVARLTCRFLNELSPTDLNFGPLFPYW